jgi:hypothetical protein
MTPVIKISKRIEFRYSRHDKEIIVDREGRFPSYSPGDLVERRGKTWKAVQVEMPNSYPGSFSLSVQVVTLSDRI